jgi:hypothetical protein
MDAEKLNVLREWANGLEGDARVEVAAAGRAIVLLIDEIERLHVHLWDKQLYPEVPAAQDLAEDPGQDPTTLSHRRTRLRKTDSTGNPHPSRGGRAQPGRGSAAGWRG